MTSRANSVDLAVNLTRVQFVLALVAHALAILGVALTLALWVGRVLIAQEFQLQLEIFHSHAKPAIEEMVNAKILDHSTGSLLTRQTDTSRLATLEEHARSTDVQLQRIEDKLDRLLERR